MPFSSQLREPSSPAAWDTVQVFRVGGLSNLDSNTVFVFVRAASRTSKFAVVSLLLTPALTAVLDRLGGVPVFSCHEDEFTMLEARPGELYTTTQSKSTPGAPCTS